MCGAMGGSEGDRNGDMEGSCCCEERCKPSLAVVNGLSSPSFRSLVLRSDIGRSSDKKSIGATDALSFIIGGSACGGRGVTVLDESLFVEDCIQYKGSS